MDGEINENEGGLISPDFSELKNSIEVLITTMQTQIEIAENEKLLQLEKEKELEQQQIEDGLKNEETLLEVETADTEYKESVLSVQENQAETLDVLVVEMQTLNQNTLLVVEKMDKQNDLIIESGLSLIITIVIVAAVKVFIDQITKW